MRITCSGPNLCIVWRGSGVAVNVFKQIAMARRARPGSEPTVYTRAFLMLLTGEHLAIQFAIMAFANCAHKQASN